MLEVLISVRINFNSVLFSIYPIIIFQELRRVERRFKLARVFHVALPDEHIPRTETRARDTIQPAGGAKYSVIKLSSRIKSEPRVGVIKTGAARGNERRSRARLCAASRPDDRISRLLKTKKRTSNNKREREKGRKFRRVGNSSATGARLFQSDIRPAGMEKVRRRRASNV